MPPSITVLKLTAITLLVLGTSTEYQARETAADADALRAQIVGKYEQIAQNESVIRDNEAGLDGLANFSAQYNQLVGADLERITRTRNDALARCEEILDVYQEKKDNCITNANTPYNEAYAVLVKRLKNSPLDFAGESITTFDAYFSKTRFTDLVKKEYEDEIAVLQDANNRLRHEIGVDEMTLRVGVPITVAPPEAASLNASSEADGFPEGGSILDAAPPAPGPARPGTEEDNLFPDGGSIREAGNNPARPAADEDAAMLSLGAGITGFDRGPAGPRVATLSGFWQLPATGAVFQIFSTGGQYNGKVIDTGQSANLTTGQVVWYKIHRPHGEQLWSGNGLYEDENRKLKLATVRFDLSGDSLTVYDRGSDPFVLIRTARPR